MLSDDDRKALLRIARQTLAAALGAGPRASEAAGSPALQQPCGCFVTLHNAGHLRGCIGTFTARGPLHQTVAQMATAALRDPRFVTCPVTAGELPKIDIEISVLSPLERTKDPMAEVELGKHGIWIQSPYGAGCFLPQVATETGWTKEEFFGHCCAHKAGLSPDAWRWPETAVYRFEAEVFGEKDKSNDEC
jgi:AmmeMemoRadiSam system protein A